MSLHYVNLFFFNDTATTEIYTLSLHDALPISQPRLALAQRVLGPAPIGNVERNADHTAHLPIRFTQRLHACAKGASAKGDFVCRRLATQGPFVGTNRSEEHTSELQSRLHLVCRLLL